MVELVSVRWMVGLVIVRWMVELVSVRWMVELVSVRWRVLFEEEEKYVLGFQKDESSNSLKKIAFFSFFPACIASRLGLIRNLRR